MKSLYSTVQEEETSNHAAQRHYGTNGTNIRQWKKQKEQLNMAWTMMLCVKTVIKNCQMMTLVT
jgi:hypothetical protein